MHNLFILLQNFTFQYVNICKDICKKSKVFEINADIYITKGKRKAREKEQGIMGLNVSASLAYNLENRDILRNNAKNILSRGGASTEATQKIIEKTLFNNDSQIREAYINPQMNVLKASTQITLNESLKETLKYLREHANKKENKKPVLGELWNIFETNNSASEQNPYRGELYDFVIDKNVKNIFAA